MPKTKILKPHTKSLPIAKLNSPDVLKAIKDYMNSSPQTTLKTKQIYDSNQRKAGLIIGYFLDPSNEYADIETMVQIAKEIHLKGTPNQIIVDREDHRIDYAELMRMWIKIGEMKQHLDITDKSDSLHNVPYQTQKSLHSKTTECQTKLLPSGDGNFDRDIDS
jgi:hypothetical protein